MSKIRNIWDELGFSGNPFHTDALKATIDDRALYVRRTALEGRLGTWLASEERGGIFVAGPVGVGKTTFVNQTQLAVQDEIPSVLPCDDVVEIQSGSSVVDVVLTCIASALRALQDHRPDVVGSRRFQDLEEELRRTRIITWNVGAQVFTMGAHGGRSVVPTEPPVVTLQALQMLLEKTGALVSEAGFDKTILVINNLDNVEPSHVWNILHDLRDTLLQRPGFLFVFIGPAGLRDSLASDPAHRRISDVLSNTVIEVGSLSREETWKVLEARLDHFGKAVEVSSPVSRTLVDSLYSSSSGELRYILNRLGDILRLVAESTATRGPVDDATAMAALLTLVRRDIEAKRLTETKTKVLRDIVLNGKAQPKEFEAFGFNSASAFLAHLRDLMKVGLLDRMTNPDDSRESIYRPRGDAVLYFQRTG